MPYVPSSNDLVILNPHESTSTSGLQHGDDLGQTFISHLFQLTKQTSFEEDLGKENVATSILQVITRSVLKMLVDNTCIHLDKIRV